METVIAFAVIIVAVLIGVAAWFGFELLVRVTTRNVVDELRAVGVLAPAEDRIAP